MLGTGVRELRAPVEARYGSDSVIREKLRDLTGSGAQVVLEIGSDHAQLAQRA